MVKISAILLCGIMLMSAMAMNGNGNDQDDNMLAPAATGDIDYGNFSLGGLLNPQGIRESKNTRIISPDELLMELPGEVPAAIDNSAGLPPVGHQQTQASCSAWAIGYYHATYIENQENPCDLSDPNNQVSPAFLYNVANGGYNGGSDMNDVADLLISNGACSMAEMPYDTSDYTSWPDQDWKWVSGMKRKAVSKTWLDITRKNGLDALKAHLAAGNTAVTHIQVWSNFDYIQNFNYTYCTSEKYGSDRGGHSVAVCGYDDDFPTADGPGALRMVNSWGTGWGEAGYWWMSYETLKDSSMCYGQALYLESEVNYEPKMVAKAEINHDYRGDIVKYSGLEIVLNEGGPDLGSKSFLGCPQIENYYDYYGYDIQKYPFPGGKMAFDITEFIPSMNSLADHVFEFSLNNQDNVAGTLLSFEIINADWWEGSLSWEAPMTIAASSITPTYAIVEPGIFYHMPIRIDSDLDMEHQKIGEFWEGDGSISVPYIMPDYLINGTGSGYCIFVGNTTDSFIVQDCYLHDAIGLFSWPYYYEAGLHLYNVQNALLRGNNVSYSPDGIFLYLSDYNAIENNMVYLNTWEGVFLDSANNNTLSDNVVSNNGWAILLNEANTNVLENNTVKNSDNGIFISMSTGNLIYHNSIINNLNQSSDDSGTNSWDNGYPSGGNYWSDYSGIDVNSGPDQDIPGADGLGDTPYIFDLVQDNYPLMAPWVPPEPVFFNISITTGWNLISIPLILEDTSVESVLASIDGQYDRVKYYDYETKLWETHRPGNPLNTLSNIDYGMGFWLRATEDTTLMVSGTAPANTAVTLKAGWNLVSYPSLDETHTVAEVFFGTGYTMVEGFSTVAPYVSVLDGSYTMMPGEGYWVNVPADTVWTVEW